MLYAAPYEKVHFFRYSHLCNAKHYSIFCEAALQQMDTDLSSRSISAPITVVDKLWTERVGGKYCESRQTLKFAGPGITETVPHPVESGDPERYLQQAFALSFRTIKAKLYRK